MFEGHNFLLFLGAAVLLNLAPGPDLFYVLSRSIAQGRRAGMLSSLGVGTGSLVHALAAALGLSAILATSALAFSVIKWVGAIYLIGIGIQALLSKQGAFTLPDEPGRAKSGWVIYTQGVLTDVLNPKVAIFFLAFLPQFVVPEGGCRAVQLITLGAIVIGIGLVWEFVVISFAARITDTLRQKRWVARWLNRTMGIVFVGLGLRLAGEKA